LKVILGLGPVLGLEGQVLGLGPVLVLEGQVLGPVLGLKGQVLGLGPVLVLEGQVLGPVLGLEPSVLVNITDVLTQHVCGKFIILYYSEKLLVFCVECPGGAGTPCSGHGQCHDGFYGNGSCTCAVTYTMHMSLLQ